MTLVLQILSSDTTMAVSLATSGSLLRSNHVYVCPAAKHIIFNPDSTLTLSSQDRLALLRPSRDWLFESAAASYRERTFAIVLRNLRNDGARGVVAVRSAGGSVMVQDPCTCEHPENAHGGDRDGRR